MFVCCCFFHEHIQEIKKVGKELGIVPTVIRDEELKTRGFGGGWGLVLADPGLRSGLGYVGGRGAPGCMVCRPKLRSEGTQPASSPEARPWEADHLWGREEAAIQILIQILEASGAKASPPTPSAASHVLPSWLPGSPSRAFLFLEYTSSRLHQGLHLRPFLSGMLSPEIVSRRGRLTLHVLATSSESLSSLPGPSSPNS